MAKSEIGFQDFIVNVFPGYQSEISKWHEIFIGEGLSIKIEEAKNGHVVSYIFKKRTILNYVFRKSGLVARIYGENAAQYKDALDEAPESIKSAIDKAGVCKRLTGIAPCNTKCLGYTFMLGDTEYKKCRYGAFMFPITDETLAPIFRLVLAEIKARKALAD